MERRWWWKLAFLMGSTLWAVLYILPTFLHSDPANSKLPFSQKINLGLDLQGGLYMVLGVDFNKVYKDVMERQAESIRGRFKEKGVALKSVRVVTEGQPIDDPKTEMEFAPADRDTIYEALKKEFWSLRFTEDTSGKFQLGLAHQHRSEIRERTINQSMEVIRNRIDQFGVSEPGISSQGSDRIVVELPGVAEVDRAKELIGRTAKLEWKLVDDSKSHGEIMALVQQIEKEKNIVFKDDQFTKYVQQINEHARGKIPEGDVISFERVHGPTGKAVDRVPYLVKGRPEVTGDDLLDAQVQFDQQTQAPIVSFSLNPRGADLFDKTTAANIGKRLAIVLDNVVYSAPTIQSRIGGGRGQITLGRSGGQEVMKEAKDLAIVLRAGALPAQLEFMEQRVMGPSLGADSIRRGVLAGIVGCLAVFLFTALYYRVSGVIAVISLVLNVIFVLAILVGLEATLTLPGIAGIALTVGIAVDSNVVIYERIREELRLGKRLHGAVEAGFQKAFRTIMDANVTNAAAALVLMSYGTGPVKGFAVTMLIGIVTTLFTAVFVCKVMFDYYLKRLEARPNAELSI